MREMKAIARPFSPNHELAAQLWNTGIYEARTVAVLVDDPAAVSATQMDRWANDFDNWAIVDTACFHLFDKSPDAWEMPERWVSSDAEFVKRASFALIWGLALHDKEAGDDEFLRAISLVESSASDDRHLVLKAQVMALKAIAKKRPTLDPEVRAAAERLSEKPNSAAPKVGKQVLRGLES